MTCLRSYDGRLGTQTQSSLFQNLSSFHYKKKQGFHQKRKSGKEGLWLLL